MAITITANDANKDGKGINFSAYLKNYDKTYDSASYGDFSSEPKAGPSGVEYGGAEYATFDKKDYGAILVSGSKRWSYDMSTHVVTGSIAAVKFGNNIKPNYKADKFSVLSDLQVSGLSITNQTLVDKIVGDLMSGKTASLIDIIKANAVTFKGSAGADVFTGFAKADKISGGSGNDTLKGAGGNDSIYGGNGNDKLYGDAGSDGIKGGAGNDAIYGGTGNDRLYGEAGSDGIKGGSGNDKIYGGAGNDRLYGEAGSDGIKGGSGNDAISGGSGNDRLYGDSGNDTVRGGSGNDTLYGGSGKDKLYGDAGNDKLYGGTGNDTLTGGAGKDTFVFKKNEGNDRITDFDAGSAKTDVIQLSKSVLKNFSDVLDHTTDTASGALIDYGKGSILLSNVEKFDLHANDFLFV